MAPPYKDCGFAFKCAVVSIFVVAFVAGDAAYDEHCDQIESNAQMANQLMRNGRQSEAFASIERSRESFRSAKKLVPSDPQAFVSLATALLNSNQLDEALPLWRGARKRVKDDNAGDAESAIALRSWLEGRERWTRYGKVSMRRDKIYAGGQGNLSATVALIAKQVEIFPQSPMMLHDQATTHLMVSEIRGAESAQAAVEGFPKAQRMAVDAWRAGVVERGRGGASCSADDTADSSIVYDWLAWHRKGTPSALMGLTLLPTEEGSRTYGSGDSFHDEGSYVAHFENVGIAGPDGIIVDETRCNIFLTAAGSFINLESNLQLLEVWGDRPTPDPKGPRFKWHDTNRGRLPDHGAVAKPKAVESAASIVGFASSSHFHMITETFGRLWLLLNAGVFDDTSLRLIAPQDRSDGKGFISVVLSLLVPDLVKQQRIIWWGTGGAPDVRLQVQSLQYADWRPPADLGKDGGHCGTPRTVLLLVRDGLLSGLDPEAEEEDDTIAPRSLIWITRPVGDMRGKLEGESKLRKELKSIAADATPESLVFTEFNGKLPPSAAVKLFRRAGAIVGVHGGALSNILFCLKDAKIFEIGFFTPFAGHYRHLAVALGLELTLLPLAVNERGLAANEVRLADGDAAIAVIRKALVARAVVRGDEL